MAIAPQAPQPVAPTLSFDAGVRIEPVQARQPAPEPVMAEPAPAPQPLPRAEEPFIPPAPDRSVLKPVRMPASMNCRVRCRPRSLPANSRPSRSMLHHAEAGVVRLRRRDEQPAAQHAAPAPAPCCSGTRPERVHASPVAAQPVRAAQGQLDPHGRQQAARSSDDDQLEIPAFLRRAN